MTRTMLLRALLCAALAPAHAFQFPFAIPYFSNPSDAQQVLEPPVPDATNRVAIIGAGAGGASAAFWIGKARERWGLDVEVDVYEREVYVGGRSTTVQPYGDASLRPIELGASIFVKANKNLWRATEEFNISRYDFTNGDEDSETGIWDGEKFVIVMGPGKGLLGTWWETAKMLWRYGYSGPSKTQAIVKELVRNFLRFYEREPPVWSETADVVSTLGWTGLAARSGMEYLDLEGVNKKFSRELVEAATRVNYGQTLDEIHALGATVSLAASGASSAVGGNRHIFETFLGESGARLHLNTTITAIKKYSEGWMLESAEFAARPYAGVILAAPFHSTGIALSPSNLTAAVPKTPYVHLHVTLLATTAPHPSAAYFNLPPDAKTPKTVLTTKSGGKGAGLEFNSLAYQRPIRTVHVDEAEVDEHVVKIFTSERVEDQWLETMFGEGKVGWVYRHEWDAYPYLQPSATFPPAKLDDGLYYVNAFEPVMSTMETETIAARNVVDLLLAEKWRAGICRSPAQAQGEEEGGFVQPTTEDFVYGWDC